MKKMLFCILAVMPLLFASCESKNDVENPKDDVGGEMIVHVGDCIRLFGQWSAYVEIQDGNMACSPYNGVYVASVGKVNSLKEINYVPTSGWEEDMEITIGHGYVIKQEGNSNYCRVRFLEYIDKGSAKGYRIRLQEWDPLLEE